MGNSDQNLKKYSIIEQVNSSTTNLEMFNFAMDNIFQSITNLIKFGVMQKELKDVVDMEYKLKNLANEIDLFNSEDLQKAYKLGVLKTLIELSQTQHQKQDIEIYFILDKLKQHKHLIEMINILYKNNSLTHQELALELNISKSALTNMVNKTEHLKVYTTERRGKHKYYYSNIKTKKVYIAYHNNGDQIYSKNDVEDLLNLVFLVINKELNDTNKLSYESISQQIPFFNTPTPKKTNSLKYFIRTINKKTEKKHEEIDDFMKKNIFDIPDNSDYMMKLKKIKINEGEF